MGDATIGSLSTFFTGKINKYLIDYISVAIADVLLIIGDIWAIYNLINSIKKGSEKKSILSKVFYILIIILIVLFILPFIIAFFPLITNNKI